MGLQSLLDTLSTYPRWLIILAGCLVGALALWIVSKLIKLALWITIIALLAGGILYTAWTLFH